MNVPVRSFEDAPAIRSQVPLMIGIMSPSGGGKTYSALRLATGMQQVLGGDIYGIDTENGRMLHYADTFKFRHVPFAPPVGSLDYLAALKYCASKGSWITIVDSMSHEHIGEGGYPETAEAVIDRIAGNDYKKREAVKMLGWAKAGPLRQKMIEGIKQLDGVFIFCFRAKEKTKPVKKDGKNEVIDMGFMPIAGEEWVYEMAVNCMLEPRSEGVPTWRSDHVGERMMMKCPEHFKSIFAAQQPLSEDIGRALAEWARGGSPVSPPEQTATSAASVTTSPGAGAADEQIPSAAEYHQQWGTMILGATSAEQLGKTWNGQKSLHKKIAWTEQHSYETLKDAVTGAINSMRAPA